MLIAIGVGVFLAQAFYTGVAVDSDAMTPTLRPGQFVVVSRAPYVLTVPQRGDVVAVRSRIDPGKLIFYRVTGIPGDRLNVKGGQITVNDQPLVEPYLPETTTRVEVTSNTIGQYRIGPDEYFLMNDNRDNVDDSRTSGVFARQDLVGRAWMVVWPPDSLKPISHLRPILGQ